MAYATRETISAYPQGPALALSLALPVICVILSLWRRRRRPPGPISGGRSSCMVWELKTLRPFPPLAQCHLLATTKRCDRPKDVTPVMGLEPATLEPLCEAAPRVKPRVSLAL